MYDYRIYWLQKASQESHVFDKFISIWISFNGSYAISESGISSDSEMVVSWSKKHQGDHEKLLSENADYLKCCEYLKGKLVPKRINSGRKTVTLRDINNCEEVFRVIYAIRCNLFHGNKIPADTLDVELVDNSYHILSNIYKLA